MSYLEILKEQQGGFDFNYAQRNDILLKQGIVKQNIITTGTTIVGVVYNEGIVLGSDTRATGGTIVMDKNCIKLLPIAPNMYCAGAGTAADCDYVKTLLKHQMELMRLNQNDRQSRISTVVSRLQQLLFRYMGNLGAHLILGGIDYKGPQLVMISNYGYYVHQPYTSMGSGSLCALSILEAKYKDNMNTIFQVDEAKLLVQEAIEAGIIHDLGSGTNVDLCVINKDGCQFLRNIREIQNTKKIGKKII